MKLKEGVNDPLQNKSAAAILQQMYFSNTSAADGASTPTASPSETSQSTPSVAPTESPVNQTSLYQREPESNQTALSALQKTGPDASNKAPDASKTASDASKTASDSQKSVSDTPDTPETPDIPDTPKTATDTPKTATDSSDTVSDAPKTAPDAPKNTSSNDTSVNDTAARDSNVRDTNAMYDAEEKETKEAVQDLTIAIDILESKLALLKAAKFNHSINKDATEGSNDNNNNKDAMDGNNNAQIISITDTTDGNEDENTKGERRSGTKIASETSSDDDTSPLITGDQHSHDKDNAERRQMPSKPESSEKSKSILRGKIDEASNKDNQHLKESGKSRKTSTSYSARKHHVGMKRSKEEKKVLSTIRKSKQEHEVVSDKTDSRIADKQDSEISKQNETIIDIIGAKRSEQPSVSSKQREATSTQESQAGSLQDIHSKRMLSVELGPPPFRTETSGDSVEDSKTDKVETGTKKSGIANQDMYLIE